MPGDLKTTACFAIRSYTFVSNLAWRIDSVAYFPCDSLPRTALHAASRPCATSWHARRYDPIWRRTMCLPQTPDYFCNRWLAARAQASSIASSCGSDVFDQSRPCARHGRIAQSLFSRSDRFAAFSFHRREQHRTTQLAHCHCDMFEEHTQETHRRLSNRTSDKLISRSLRRTTRGSFAARPHRLPLTRCKNSRTE